MFLKTKYEMCDYAVFCNDTGSTSASLVSGRLKGVINKTKYMKKFNKGSILAVLAVSLMFGFTGIATALAYASPGTVNLGGAASFAVLSSTAITNVPTSVITGDIGVSPAAATFITGFTCPAVTGTVHVVSAGGDTSACQTVDPTYLTPTVLEYETAYTDAAGRTPDATISTALDGLMLTPGVYTATDLDLNNGSNLTLDCGGDANGVFIFQTAGHLNVGTSAHVNLIGSCQPGNVFWAVAGVTNILGGVGTESTFQGTVLGGQGTTEISLGVGSTILGRLMSDKTIALQSNTITVPSSTPPPSDPVFIDLNGNNLLDSGEQHFATIQAAVDAAAEGAMIDVTPGTYNEGNLSRDIYTGASGGPASGLLVYKNGLTIQGVDNSGNLITNRANVVATVIATQRDASLGDTVITGDNVTLSGLRFQLATIPVSCNKNVFATGENFTLKNSVVDNLTTGCSGLYLSDERGGMHVNSFTIQDNRFLYGEITVINGVGQSGPVSGRKIVGNLIEHVTDWAGVSLTGITGSSWTTQPIGDVTITGNSFADDAYQIIARGSDYANPVGYWSGFLAGNTFDKAVITLTPEGDARTNAYERLGWVNSLTDPLKNPNFRMIGTNIQEGVSRATAGDTVKAGAGTYNEQVVVDGKNITLQGAGDATIIQPSNSSVLTSVYTHPSGIFWPGSVVSGILMVKNSTAAVVKDIKIDGVNVTVLPTTSPVNDRLSGVLYGESSGTIDNVTVNNIKTTGYSARTYGIELSGAASGAHGVEVKNSRVNDWGRNGIVANGPSLTANIHNNTLVGPGTISGQVPNGILFIGGTKGNATTNVISGMHYNAGSSRSAGVLVYGATTAGILVDGNDISDTDDGVDLSLSSYGATVSNNNLHNNLEVGVQLEDGTANNIIMGNMFVNNATAGIRFGGASDPVEANADTPPGAGNVAHYNSFSGNAAGVVNWDTGLGQIFDATHNWWGNASGPTNATTSPSGTGNSITDNVTFNPWFTDATMTTLNTYSDATVTSTGDLPAGITDVVLSGTTVLDLSNATTSIVSADVTVGGNIVTLTQEVTLQSGVNGEPIVLTNSSLANVSVSIPDGTIIQGPTGWDGTIAPPITGDSSGTAPSGFTVGSTLVVGSPEVTLVFSNPVTLVLAGVTGTVGYKPSGSNTWITINTVCTGTYESPTGAPLGGECKITNGTDTKVLTYHFTTFGGFNEIVPPTPPPASGGGGPMGLFGVMNVNNQGTQNAQAVVSQTPAFTNAANPSPQGQVLGASTFRFTGTLGVGSRGDEVKELQNRLTSEGVYSGPVTGYFGSLTSQAVKAFQAKYGIGQDGTVGQQTRDKLNSPSGCSQGNKFNTITGESCPSSAGSEFGAAVSAFARNLAMGSRGDDVTALQNRLTSEGVYSGPVTGYFGSLTSQAVKAFQAKYGISQVGKVGPLTREALNKNK